MFLKISSICVVVMWRENVNETRRIETRHERHRVQRRRRHKKEKIWLKIYVAIRFIDALKREKRFRSIVPFLSELKHLRIEIYSIFLSTRFRAFKTRFICNHYIVFIAHLMRDNWNFPQEHFHTYRSRKI